jgi:hypothetical protein
MNNPLLQSVQLALHNGAQAEAIAFIDKVVDFCIEMENGKVLDGWPRDLIQLLVAYHMAKDTFIVEQDEDGKILGVFMWYNCDEDDDWFFIQNWTLDQGDGNAIFLAFIFAENNTAFKGITRQFIAKCPEVTTKKLISIRHRQGTPTRVTYTPKLFNKILGVI